MAEAAAPQRVEIRFTGLGGQGVVLAAHVVGRACAIEAGNHATMMQSFGPEARGSACSATLVVSSDEVLYPYVNGVDVLVAMSAEGYEKHAAGLGDDGLLLYERDLVEAAPRPGQRAFGIPSTRIAESLGRAIVQNMVMVGFFTGVTGLVPVEAMHAAVEASAPPGTAELNLAAFAAGFDYAADVAAAVPAGGVDA